MDRPPDRAYVNAFLRDERSIVALYRGAAGQLLGQRVDAEWVSYHRPAELARAGLDAVMRKSPFVRAVTVEGSWARVSWASRRLREDALHDQRSPIVQAGVAHYEGDVHPITRWLTDRAPRLAHPRRCFLDIETDSRVSFAEKEKMRVLCWALSDEDRRPIATGVLDEWSDRDERRLLLDYWAAVRPYDQVVCWNGSFNRKEGAFDFYVLDARSQQRQVAFDPRLQLRVDYLPLYKRQNAHSGGGEEKQSMRLGEIAQSELGEGKEEVPGFVLERFGEARCRRGLGAMSYDLWEAGGEFRALLVRYCQKDAALIPGLDRKKGYLGLTQAACDVCHLFFDQQSLLPSVQADGMLLRFGLERDHHWPTRTWRGDTGEDPLGQYEGSYNMEPKVIPGKRWSAEEARAWREEGGMRDGILRGVHVFDFSRMYPSQIVSWNMSPETRAPVPVNGPIPPGHSRCPTTGTGFRTDAPGMLALAVKVMLAGRADCDKRKADCPPGSEEWANYDALSQAWKVLANALYGIIGARSSRYHDRAVAEGITQNAAWLIKATLFAAEERGWRPFYSDSITGDRVLVARDPQGRVQLLPAEVLWERGGGTRASRGKQFRLLEGWRALAEGAGGRRGWFPIERIIRHRAGKTMWRVTTKHGQTHVTEDHGIMCGGRETRPADFVSGREVFTTLEAPPERPREEIDLYEYVVGAEHRSPGGRSVARFEPSAEWLTFKTMNSPPVRVRRFYVRGTPEWAALLRLLAAYASDGSASVEGAGAVRSLLSFCKADLALQEQVATDLRTISPGLPVFGPYWSDTVYVVRSGTHAMALLFRALGGAGATEKRLADFFFELDAGGFAIVRGMLERGDGCVDAAGQLSFTTTSQRLAAGVSYLLSQHGCPHGWCFRESKGAWQLRTRKGRERPSRYRIKAEVFEPDASEWVYDLTVGGSHTFVDGVGRVLLHNTDSGFVVGPTREEFWDFVEWCNRELYPPMLARQGCVENAVQVAYEKEFERVVFTAGKRYFGQYLHFKWTGHCECDVATEKYRGPGRLDYRTYVCRDCGRQHDPRALPPARGKPEIKGIEMKRGDAIRLARALQARVVDMLVGGLRTGAERTDDLEAFHALLGKARRHVLEDPLPLAEIVQSKGLTDLPKKYKVAPGHAKLAQVLIDRGEQVGVGSKIEYVVLDGYVSPHVLVPAAEYDGANADRYYLWESLVFPPLRRLLEGAFPDHDWSGWERVRPPRPKGGARVLPGQLGLPSVAAVRVEQGIRPLAAPSGIAQPRANPGVSSAGDAPAEPFCVELYPNMPVAGAGWLRPLLEGHPGARPAVVRYLHRGSGEWREAPVGVSVDGGDDLADEVERRLLQWGEALDQGD